MELALLDTKFMFIGGPQLILFIHNDMSAILVAILDFYGKPAVDIGRTLEKCSWHDS